MVVILDTTQGEAFNFNTRKDAALYLGISLVTLRKMLEQPFYLYGGNTIVTFVGNGKVEKSQKALRKRLLLKDIPTNGS